MSLDRLVDIMKRLRDPVSGCEWDSVQSFKTIAPYTIEEAYEVADAIQRGDMAALADELGDLQLQIVFHARMAEEAGLFTLDDVMCGISDKMERRHPHIFGDATEGGHYLWEQIKAEERAANPDQSALAGVALALPALERAANPDQSALAGVALALPALERAAKLQKRAARTGFDWPDIEGPKAKIAEELDEIAAAPADKLQEEVGDLLFAVVNLARFLKIDPEEALRQGNAKFERRFRTIEQAPGFKDMTLNQMEEQWSAAKAAETAPNSPD